METGHINRYKIGHHVFHRLFSILLIIIVLSECKNGNTKNAEGYPLSSTKHSKIFPISSSLCDSIIEIVENEQEGETSISYVIHSHSEKHSISYQYEHGNLLGRAQIDKWLLQNQEVLHLLDNQFSFLSQEKNSNACTECEWLKNLTYQEFDDTSLFVVLGKTDLLKGPIQFQHKDIFCYNAHADSSIYFRFSKLDERFQLLQHGDKIIFYNNAAVYAYDTNSKLFYTIFIHNYIRVKAFNSRAPLIKSVTSWGKYLLVRETEKAFAYYFIVNPENGYFLLLRNDEWDDLLIEGDRLVFKENRNLRWSQVEELID